MRSIAPRWTTSLYSRRQHHPAYSSTEPLMEFLEGKTLLARAPNPGGHVSMEERTFNIARGQGWQVTPSSKAGNLPRGKKSVLAEGFDWTT